MWSKLCEVMNPYEAIEDNNKKLNFWEKIFRISYTNNAFGVYQEIYLFNKKVSCKLICIYVYK